MSGNTLIEGASACVAKAAVLVVEDDVLTRMATSEELRDYGYSVVEAANVDEALAVLHGPTRIDLVVTDMKMPGALDGAALAQHIRTELPFVKVVMISGQTPAPEVRRILDGYLPKPVAPADLASYVQELTPAHVSSKAS